ncbi:unnamed protein product, partial [Phytomonas sp. Hart1]
MPSRADHGDLMVRLRAVRSHVAQLHFALLGKARILRLLMLLPPSSPAFSSSSGETARYHAALTGLRGGLARLAGARGAVDTARVNLVAGVAARLVSRCNVMDYINNVQTQMALVLFPTSLIPGVWTMNVMVPWRSGPTLTPFFSIVAITLSILLLGLSYPLYKYYTYKPPGALVPSFD